MKAIIVDDERLAIKGIERLLNDYPFVDLEGSAGTIEAAVELVASHSPDLIFLDIQLQGETGFDLFDRTHVDARVVFVTAYDNYAVQAFEINAVDYLLKPVSRERFAITMDRIKRCTSAPKSPGRLDYRDRVVLRTDRGMRFVKLDQILSITAEGDYSRVSINRTKDELILKSMKAWEALLPRGPFVRIHRSTIINITFVQKIEKTTSNRYLAYLVNNPVPTPISQRYSARLRKKVSMGTDQFNPNVA